MIEHYFFHQIPKDILNQIVLIDRNEMTFFWGDQLWHDCFNDSESYIVFTYEDKKQVRGFCLFLINPFDKSAHLLKIATSTEHQRKGMALELLRYSIEDLARKDMGSIFLEVESDNTVAINLYAKCSFVKINTVKRFYSNGKDANMMQLAIK